MKRIPIIISICMFMLIPFFITGCQNKTPLQPEPDAAVEIVAEEPQELDEEKKEEIEEPEDANQQEAGTESEEKLAKKKERERRSLDKVRAEKELWINDEPLPEIDDTCLVKYRSFVARNEIKSMALIFLDADDIPELLTIENGQYHVYGYKDSEVYRIAMPEGVEAHAYGYRYSLVDMYPPEELTFIWFSYVPRKSMVRVSATYSVRRGCDEEKRIYYKRHDYYLRYNGDSFVKELETEDQDTDRFYNTYDNTGRITNEAFLEKMEKLGYDELEPCAFLQINIADAYQRINQRTDTKQVLEYFLDGKIDAMICIEGESDIPRENYVTKSYQEIYDEGSDDSWSIVPYYVDFDNDGEDELDLVGEMCSHHYFDVIGTTVYPVITSGGTSAVASVAEYEGKNIVQRTDYTHVGRMLCQGTRFDSCGALIDYFYLAAEFEEREPDETYRRYSAEDDFYYRHRKITMEEFEEIFDKIQKTDCYEHR